MKSKTTDCHVYLPPDLAAKLKKIADSQCRSLTQQIVFMLLSALKEAK